MVAPLRLGVRGCPLTERRKPDNTGSTRMAPDGIAQATDQELGGSSASASDSPRNCPSIRVITISSRLRPLRSASCLSCRTTSSGSSSSSVTGKRLGSSLHGSASLPASAAESSPSGFGWGGGSEEDKASEESRESDRFITTAAWLDHTTRDDTRQHHNVETLSVKLPKTMPPNRAAKPS